MLRRFGLGFVFMILFSWGARAQDNAQAESAGEESAAVDSSEGDFIFPVYLLYETAAGGKIEWQPDWPADIPVDTFRVLNKGEARLVTALTLEGGGVNLTLRRNRRGVLTEFPLFLNGAFYRFRTNFDSVGKIRGFTAADEKPAEIEFLAFENPDGKPSLARIHGGESWFFASILYEDAFTIETWYDADGNPLAVFTAELTWGRPKSYRSVFAAAAGTESSGGDEDASDSTVQAPVVSESRLYFDGAGNTTRIEADGNVFEALYKDAGLSYWKSPALGHAALQWDENGRLVRMAGFAGDDVPIDFRYEYEFDGQGAWTERREFRMTEEMGVLIPSSGLSFKRTIEYR
ncbi:MAG: hypothetical protein LBP37_02355 [Spirochaetaceae bacterium]|jgi:hypothetical protein|nr:hypothetical protein [Spirochaetaceae bacterium]